MSQVTAPTIQDSLPELSGVFDKMITIAPQSLWILAGIVLIALVIISVVFLYHWLNFGVSVKRMALVIMVYLIGAVSVSIFMVVSLGYYILSV